MIDIRLDSAEIEAGEFITGEVRWKAEDARELRKLIVAAQWQAKGGDNNATGLGRAIQGKGVTLPFRMKIPYEGPVTFGGESIMIEWKIRVRADVPGFDEFAEVGFRVSPRRARREGETT